MEFSIHKNIDEMNSGLKKMLFMFFTTFRIFPGVYAEDKKRLLGEFKIQ